jgi:hypothetical protein
MVDSVFEIQQLAIEKAIDAWNSWENWLISDPTYPRLKLAVEAANKVWLENIVEKGAVGYEVIFINGPLENEYKLIDNLDQCLLMKPGNSNIISRLRYVYTLIPNTLTYSYQGSIDLLGQ